MLMRSLTLSIVLTISCGFAFAQEKEKIVHGTVRAVDRENGTISVLLGTGKPQVKTLNLIKMDLPVTHPLARPLKLADVNPNHRVALKVVDEDVIGIQYESDTDWGQIVSISDDHKVIAARFGHAVRSIPVDSKLQIFVDGEPAAVKDLKPNGYVNVHLSPDHRRVVQLRQGKGITIGHPYGRYLIQSGVLLNKDDAAKKLTVVALGERYEKQDFTYDAWTAVRLTYSSYTVRPSSIDEIKGHCKISFYYESDLKRISSMAVDVPLIVRRHITKYDPATRRLTIALDDDNRTEEFTVAADAMMIKEGKPIGEDWLQENRFVSLGLSLDQKQVILVVALEK